MNITLKTEHFKVKSVSEDGSYITIEDSIGFSTGDELPGFNRFDTSYIDVHGDPYPKVTEVVLAVYAYINKFDGSVSPSTIMSNVYRDSDTSGQTYGEIAYNVKVSLPEDGWLTLHAMLVPKESLTGVYYNETQGIFLDETVEEGENNQVLISNLVGRQDIYSVSLHTFQTVNSERTLNNMIGDLTDTAIFNSVNSKEYKGKEKLVRLHEVLIAGAHIKFHDGSMSVAQQIIEDVKNTAQDGEY